MPPLLKKEIRLLLPAWLAVLLLETGLPWIGRDHDLAIIFSPAFFFFGMVLLAVDSFGREFSLGTFASLMIQPVERRHLWRTKLSVLLAAAALIFAVYFISCDLRLHLGLVDGHARWFAQAKLADAKFSSVMIGSGAGLLIALTGGLWTALWLRQISSAFWIALLAPVGLLLLTVFATSRTDRNDSGPFDFPVIYGMAGLYIAFAFWLAHRLFFRAQDAGWTGGVISLSKWRYFEKTTQAGISRRRRPLVALLKTELNLHSVSLLVALGLLGLHFGVLFLRVFHVHSHPNELAEVVSDGYWFLWLTLSLMIGCTAVAEERKMGLTESQFCLPVSRRLQFLLKLVFTLIFGALLGGVMPVVLETAARHYGAASEIYKNSNPFIILAVAAGVAWVGFFASTLARNFLQALSLAIVILVGCCFSAVFIGAFASGPTSLPGTIGGLFVIPWMLLGLLGVPTLGVLFIWLAYRNFCHFLPGSRRWRRDVAGVLGALLFVGGGSLLIYHRPWELLQAAEPPHGAALFSRANRPVFQSEGDQGQDDNANLRVRLPDGRVWCDTLVPFYFDKNPSFWKVLWRALVNPAPVNSGPRAFMAGSNWVSATTQQTQLWDAPQGQTVIRRLVAGYLDTVGVRSDGTLWISSEAKPFAWTGAHMTQFGTENNWRQVVRWQNHLLLLKTDGTLWHWGTNNPYWHQGQWESHWPSVRQDQPRQIGTNADWMDIFPSSLVFARKQDGTVWRLESEPEPVKVGQVGRAGNRRPEPLRAEVNFKIQRWADLDPVVFPTFSGMAYVGRDGTLWMAGQRYFAAGGIRAEGTGFMPVGRETNWLAVAMSRHRLVALKTDGTLWQWDMSSGISSGGVMLNPATRLGIHDDWMALARSDSGVVSLAADGSLWLWPEIEQATLLKLPKQPEWLGNVFGKSDE